MSYLAWILKMWNSGYTRLHAGKPLDEGPWLARIQGISA